MVLQRDRKTWFYKQIENMVLQRDGKHGSTKRQKTWFYKETENMVLQRDRKHLVVVMAPAENFAGLTL